MNAKLHFLCLSTVVINIFFLPASVTAYVLPTNGVENYIVQLAPTFEENSPSITLNWDEGPDENVVDRYEIWRKTLTGTSWGSILTTLPSEAREWTDTDVTVGTGYEYQIKKTATGSVGYSYGYLGMKVPLIEDRGKIILIVEETIADELSSELSTLEQDLAGDGWTVLRHDVSSGDTVTEVKALITTDYTADPSNVKSVFLFGHVPVPYSGDLAPDGHNPSHKGAWPADTYYGNMGGNWTDTTVTDTAATDPRNDNIPGDGKFDNSYIPISSDEVQLEVGRVDFNDMPAFSPKTEVDLLRQYLEKNHAYRIKAFEANERALISDNFGPSGGEALASMAWTNSSVLTGVDNITDTTTEYMDEVRSSDGFVLTYGSGPGAIYDGATNIGTTANFASAPTYGVFNMLFGSYFGDWDNTNNFIKAPLAAEGYGLTSVWGGRPLWFFHHMGLGKNIGYGARLSQINTTPDPLYNRVTAGWGQVHTALMGDPTLRLNMVTPIEDLDLALSEADSEVSLSWTASPDSGILGYHVYRATNSNGPFTRISDDLIEATQFNDTPPATGTYTYMVRAARLETTPSGSYYNASQGIFASTSVVIVSPSVATNPGSGVSRQTATLNGTITDLGGAEVTERGFEWGETTAYGETITENGSFETGAFSLTLTSVLTCSTTYHFRAYAENSAGVEYGEDLNFTTSECGSSGGGGRRSSADSSDDDNVPDTACRPGDSFSSATGLPCTSFIAPVVCPVGHLFSITTGLPCTSYQTSSISPFGTPVVPGGTSSCFITNTLIPGSIGEEVKCLQIMLNILPDGVFGPKTRQAVVLFQTFNNLIPDGIVGPLTRSKLK